jgi:hypothetical protein
MDGGRRSSLVQHLLLSTSSDTYKLSTTMGVFLPCITTIFGVVIYLRLGFLVGQAGLFGAYYILGGAFFISLLTVLSLAALVSSGTVNTGGFQHHPVPSSCFTTSPVPFPSPRAIQPSDLLFFFVGYRSMHSKQGASTTVCGKVWGLNLGPSSASCSTAPTSLG